MGVQNVWGYNGVLAEVTILFGLSIGVISSFLVTTLSGAHAHIYRAAVHSSEQRFLPRLA